MAPFRLVTALVIGCFALAIAPPLPAGESDFSFQPPKKWLGDLDGMVERRLIRALVPYSMTFYFVDRGEQHGVSYEAMTAFQDELNKSLKVKKTRQIQVLFIPVRRDQLLPYLVEGYGDIALGNITVTAARAEQVAFSVPAITGISEVPVTGPSGTALESPDALSGKEVYVRRSSSYYESLETLNERLAAAGKAPVKLTLVDEDLEDEDLLELVNADVLPMILLDSHKAELWRKILPDITPHGAAALRQEAEIAWAVRKDSPELLAAVNAFIETHKKGTVFGNITFKKYFGDTRRITDALSDSAIEKFKATSKLFETYADQYELDWLMVLAQAYQESKLDQSARSPAGAVGIMQLLPSTAADPVVGIADIEKIENNVHAGVKYLRFIADRYFDDPTIDPDDRLLLAMAAYNAGPAKVARLRKETAESGLDPNKWFQNVELIAAKRVGRETVQYVGNIYKYYIAYKLGAQRRAAAEASLEATGQQ